MTWCGSALSQMGNFIFNREFEKKMSFDTNLWKIVWTSFLVFNSNKKFTKASENLDLMNLMEKCFNVYIFLYNYYAALKLNAHNYTIRAHCWTGTGKYFHNILFIFPIESNLNLFVPFRSYYYNIYTYTRSPLLSKIQIWRHNKTKSNLNILKTTFNAWWKPYTFIYIYLTSSLFFHLFFFFFFFIF